MAASDKTASIAARPWTAAVQQSAWILMGMPLPAASAAKHSCATTAEVKILPYTGDPAPSHVEMPTATPPGSRMVLGCIDLIPTLRFTVHNKGSIIILLTQKDSMTI